MIHCLPVDTVDLSSALRLITHNSVFPCWRTLSRPGIESELSGTGTGTPSKEPSAVQNWCRDRDFFIIPEIQTFLLDVARH